MLNHPAQPRREIRRRRNLAARVGQIQVRVCVDQPRQDRDVAEVFIRAARTGRFDRYDLAILDRDRTAR